MDTNTTLQQLKDNHERYAHRVFMFALEIVAIFGVPAFAGAYFGKKLGGGTILVGMLVGTFILSWVITIVRYRVIAKKMQRIESAMKSHPDYVAPEIIQDDDDNDSYTQTS